jgi:tripartite-type tricarboxylate transporter receptor subunit TctC
MYKSTLLIVFATIAIAHAQTTPSLQRYPTKPIRMIVPWAAGGTSDVAARIVAQKLSGELSNQVFVENRPGAGGTIGAAAAAKASPDGYSLLMGSSTELVVSPHIYKKAAYTLSDFVPIAYVAAQPLVLAVNPQLPVKSVQELVTLAKARPDTINCASSGTGSTLHLAQLLFENAAQVRFFHIPYSGSPQAATSTVTGETQVHFGSLTAVLELVRNGNLRGLAVTGSKRSPALPDLPTVAEAGVPDFEIVIWNALFGPRDTPPEIIGKLNSDMDRILEAPDIREAFFKLSMDFSSMSRDQLGAMVAAEWTRMGKAVAASGATID